MLSTAEPTAVTGNVALALDAERLVGFVEVVLVCSPSPATAAGGVGGVMDEGDDPIWWLEASSYPIRIIDRDRVKVLVTSRELETRYGEAPVAVTFPAGNGAVFHMISHYYLQRTELRTARHEEPAAAYAVSMGVKLGGDLQDLTTGDVESARTSARMLSNLIAQKKRKSERS